MGDTPKISESEWTVMKVIWNDNPITANSIVDALSGTTDWKPKTIKTLLTRLTKKGAIGYENIKREYHYYPLVEESVLVKHESHSFLKRVFGGALKPMIATMVESEKLSKKEIEELKSLFENKME